MSEFAELAVSGDAGLEVCELLGVNPDAVRGVTVRFAAAGLVTVGVEIVVEPELVARVLARLM